MTWRKPKNWQQYFKQLSVEIIFRVLKFNLQCNFSVFWVILHVSFIYNFYRRIYQAVFGMTWHASHSLHAAGCYTTSWSLEQGAWGCLPWERTNSGAKEQILVKLGFFFIDINYGEDNEWGFKTLFYSFFTMLF